MACIVALQESGISRGTMAILFLMPVLSVVRYDLPGCGSVCFLKILSRVYLIPMLGDLGSINRF